MKKLFFFFAAMMVAVAMNAADQYPDPAVSNSLATAIGAVGDNEVIYLDEGTYTNAKGVDYTQPRNHKRYTIRAIEGKNPIIKLEVPFRIREGATAKFIGIKFDGSSIDSSYDWYIRAYDADTNALAFEDCEFTGTAKHLIRVPSGTKLTSLKIKDCHFYDNSNRGILNQGTIEKLQIENTIFERFSNADYSPIENYDSGTIGSFEIEGCEFTNNKAVAIYSGSKTHIDKCAINNCYFHDTKRGAVFFEAPSPAAAICDSVVITNSTFAKIANTNDYWVSIIDIRNGGSQTKLGYVLVDRCTFYDCTTINTDHVAVRVHKSIDATVSNCIFWDPNQDTEDADSKRAATNLYGGNVKNCIAYNYLYGTEGHIHNGATYTACTQDDPLFVNAAEGNYTLGEGSPALTAGTDGKAIGDPRWVPEEPAPQTLYLKISSDWKYPSKYAIHYFDNSSNGWSDFMTEVENENDIYTATIPSNYSKIIFARFDSKKESTGNWDDKWSQTVNLTLEDGKDLFTITSGGTGNECNGTWSLFEPTPAPFVCDWENISWVDGSNNKLKVCKEGEVPTVVNVQNPDWADESGIYMTFPSAAWDKSKFSLSESAYAIQGSGMLIYLSALDLEYNEIAVNCQNTDYTFTIYNADGAETVYNVAGSSAVAFGTTWDTYANKMTLDEDLYKWEKTELELAAGDITFKVVKDHVWAKGAWPNDNYVLNIPASGIYTISITFNESTKEINATATKTGEAVILPPVDVKGDWDDWAAALDMTPATDKKSCSVTRTFDATGTYQFGIEVNGSWKSNGQECTFSRTNDSLEISGYSGNMNLDIDVAGEYTFTWYYETSVLKVTYPALPILYAEYATGHEGKADFADANGRILLTLRKSGNDIVVTVKNNNAAGNTQTGLNYLWVNATGATNNNATYGSHDTENTEEVSVTVKFDAAKDTYVFNNIHWAYAGFGGEWAIDGLTVQASELCNLNNGWYLVGTFNGEEEWGVENLTPAKKFAVNPENAEEFVVAANLKTGDRFKAVYVYRDEIQADSWKPSDGDGYVVTDWTAGEKDIYFRVNYYNTWGGHFYIAPNSTTAVDNTAVEGKATKSIVNGQLLITRDGKTYNVLGTIVK